MSWLLNVVYASLLVLGLPWILYAAFTKSKYRQGYAQKLLGRVPRRRGSRPCIWLHAVSVGELMLVDTLLPKLTERFPDCEYAVSTTTRAGYELARAKFSANVVFYCPLDFSWAVAAALRRVRPELLVLVELELWPNLIAAARRRGVMVAVINGRLSESSWRGYRRIRPLAAHVLRSLDLLAVQNETYAQRFRQLGADSNTVYVTGSLKFDGARLDRDNARTRQLMKLAAVDDGDVVFLAGSTHEPEETYAVNVFRQLAPNHPRLRLILVPRHPDRFEDVARTLAKSGFPWQRRSQLDANGADREARILLVDTVGELGAWWGVCHIAFVGGSLMARGGQNMIEPAAYGAAVSFGPQTNNFRDVVADLMAARAAVVVANETELAAFVERCLLNANYARQLGRRARRLVRQQTGAAEKTIELINSLLKPKGAEAIYRTDSSHGHGGRKAAEPFATPRSP